MADAHSYSDAIERLATGCVRHPRSVYAAVALLLLGGGALAARVQVDPTPEAYLEGTEAWRYYTEIDRAYEIGETLVIAFREVGGTVFDVETITAVSELDRLLSALPTVDRVLSVATATQLTRNGDSLDLTPLLAGGITKDSALELGQRIQRHPVYNQLLVDRRHEATFLFVQLSSREASPEQRLDAVRKIRGELDRFRSKSRTVHLAGSAVTKEMIAAGVEHDMALLFPAGLVLLLVLLWFMFGELSAAALPMAISALASLLVIAGFATLGVPLNVGTATVPTTIFVVGIADSVHFLTEYRRHYARIGEREEALLTTVGTMALPCLLTACTAALGFFALAISRVAPLREFGVGAGFGLGIGYLATMALLPFFLLRLGYPKGRSVLFPAAPHLGKLATRFAIFAHQRLIFTLAVTGLASGICVAAVNRIGFDADFIRYVDEEHRLRTDIEMIESTLGGTDIIEVILDSSEPGYFKRGEGLRLLDRLATHLSKLPGVSRSFSMSDYMRLANAVMTGVTPSTDSPLPETEQAVAQLALLDPTAFSALTNEEMTQTRFTLQIRTLSTEEVLRLTTAAEEVAARVIGKAPVKATFTGLPPLFARIAHHLIEDATRSFGLATLAVFLAMLIGFRSFGTAVASMIPSLLAIGVTFATMALMGLSFDTNAAYIICLGIAVTVDATIHIGMRFLRARREGSPSAEAAIQYAITHSGHPVVLTAVLLVVGFSVLLLSSFRPTFNTGLFSVMLVIYALVLVVLLFPVLLMLADRLDRRSDRPRDDGDTRRFRRSVSNLLSEVPGPAPTAPGPRLGP